MIKTKRCPNGTRKNKDGDCIKKEDSNQTRKRCPRGTRKNKDGHCEQVNKINKSTPRTKYAKQFFKKKDIYLSNFRSKKSNPLLFQVSFHDEKQFKEYANLSIKPSLDCVYQSLFSLGLREVEKSKKESDYVNKFGKIGVSFIELKKFIGTTFGIDAKNVQSKIMDMPVSNVSSFLYNTLNDNHATMLFLIFEDYRGIYQYTHCVVAYRYKHDIFYFDPQGRGIKGEHKVLSMNLLHLVPDALKLDGVLFFTIEDLNSPKKALHVDCPIGAKG